MKVAVDGLLHPVDDPYRIIVISRKWPPFQGYFALPGGLVDEDEAVEDSLIREMREEVQLDVTIEGLLGVYSEKERDPRGHVITIAFICSFEGEPVAADDAASVKLAPVSDLLADEKLAFDHRKIISHYSMIMSSGNQETFWSKKKSISG